MKKLLAFAAVAALSWSVCAQENVDADDNEDELTSMAETPEPQHKRVAVWPAFFAVSEIPETPDLVGVRITIPFSTKQENVTGFDVGLWGRAQYFEGFQCSLIRNDVKDQLSGFQAGLYNSATQADLFGVQLGLWNEAGSLRGAQAGFVNTVGQMQGVQLGFINRAEELYGFQIGLVNVIRDADLVFMPFVNVGF